MQTSPGRGDAKGSAVLPGGERLEPNENSGIAQAFPTIADDPIRLFLPGASAKERAVRQRLRNAQTIASAMAVRTASCTARAIWRMVASLSSDWVFARADTDSLEDVANALVRLFLAANVFERIEGADA